MAYSEDVARRLRDMYASRTHVTERKMFGGLAFMVRGHMSCGIVGNELMVRVGPERHAEALARPHAREMDFTGRSMSGFVYVAPEGFATPAALESWVSLSEEFVKTLPAK